MDKYLSSKAFDAMIKNHAIEIERFPNKDVIKYNNTRFIRACGYTVELLSPDGALWYAGREVNAPTYMLHFERGFAPVDLIALIVNKRYANNPESGYISSTSNAGTAGMLTINLQATELILSANNFYKLN